MWPPGAAAGEVREAAAEADRAEPQEARRQARAQDEGALRHDRVQEERQPAQLCRRELFPIFMNTFLSFFLPLSVSFVPLLFCGVRGFPCPLFTRVRKRSLLESNNIYIALE